MIPEVSKKIQTDLYSALREFHALKPWKILRYEELFVLEFGSAPPAALVILGGQGTYHGLCVYRGPGALQYCQRIYDGTADERWDDLFASRNCLILEYCKRDELDQHDLQLMKRYGRGLAKARVFPLLRSCKSGYAPWYLDDQDAELMRAALRCAADLVKRVQDGELYPVSSQKNEYLTYKIANAADYPNCDWKICIEEPLTAEGPAGFRAGEIARVAEQGYEKQGTWEIHSCYVPELVYEEPRPYYVRLLLVCDAETGEVLLQEMLRPHESPAQALVEHWPVVAERAGSLPEAVHFRSSSLAYCLTPFLNNFDVEIEERPDLPAVSDYKAMLFAHLEESEGDPLPSEDLH